MFHYVSLGVSIQGVCDGLGM